ncbi:MAG TPA: acetyl-CoA carboxylase carboxyltransferase subunit alpha [Candidatus Hydrothermia bacterium]|nr:acetyl-CoA carboxylase carboxyltransferase subunit alpha [Candidatus Hydrothermae bacterium]MDD3649778.1 acetyl-CoA carboxylase carboxyltransferase subunit alpha [Candidatus Hydrothermia bacterium]MDD5573283.1 acetyl-CoA carboxylase carboxyltransferase subunit alpha [Candidatus Hydrothermia bacterium]HOK23691.1 acetyl-CoA carboxylase carboxyltransferase subunit alpha [Candidatus Hydrothermia bacterium]HOL24400.1 acetyl-CoA carboxylase carboxyltransferase subunit alpha [Candidatus Hydrothermi
MFYLEFERPILEIEKEIAELKRIAKDNLEVWGEIRELEERAVKLREKIYLNLNRYQKVQIARHPDRPHTMDYISSVFSDFVEIHGDRSFGDDPSIVCGFATVESYKIVFVGEEKGRSTQDKIFRNFGMPHPEGYRKAIRVIKLADKFGLPVVTFVDTPGAYPGIGAEERGQAQAIAESIKTMLQIAVPVIVVIIGEGGSGGALAIAVGNRIIAMEHAIYSVISPEGCASILWRDSTRSKDAAEALKLTAQDLFEFGIIDEIIPEPLGGAHRAPDVASRYLKEYLVKNLRLYENFDRKKVKDERHSKFRKFGVVIE